MHQKDKHQHHHTLNDQHRIGVQCKAIWHPLKKHQYCVNRDLIRYHRPL
jgi:hypothetical protein